jgi:hypothetical protein
VPFLCGGDDLAAASDRTIGGTGTGEPRLPGDAASVRGPYCALIDCERKERKGQTLPSKRGSAVKTPGRVLSDRRVYGIHDANVSFMRVFITP